jgi:hypothetical protein
MSYGALPLISTTDGKSIPGLPIVITNPPKQAVLRLPTSAELLRYLSSLRSLSRDLGRRKSESEDVPNPTADRKLFDTVRLDRSGPDFDDAEVSYALGILTRQKISSATHDDGEFNVTIETLFGKHTHTLREPFHKELREYQRNCYRSLSLPHGIEEMRFPPEVPCTLYDALVTAANGYAQELNIPIVKDVDSKEEKSIPLSAVDAARLVPPHHKRAVVLEVVSILSSLDPVIDPNS